MTAFFVPVKKTLMDLVVMQMRSSEDSPWSIEKWLALVVHLKST